MEYYRGLIPAIPLSIKEAECPSPLRGTLGRTFTGAVSK